MQKIIGAALIAVASMASGSALAEGSTVVEQRAKLKALWGQETTFGSTGQTSASRDGTTQTFISGTSERKSRAHRFGPEGSGRPGR